jgi:hypothetical protein
MEKGKYSILLLGGKEGFACSICLASLAEMKGLATNIGLSRVSSSFATF